MVCVEPGQPQVDLVERVGEGLLGGQEDVVAGTVDRHDRGAIAGQIVRKVLLPESVSALIAGATLTVVLLVGYSAMAGVIGGGGLGDFAIVYGYQRFNTPVLLVAVVVLIVLVQVMQSIGDGIVRALRHRK